MGREGFIFCFFDRFLFAGKNFWIYSIDVYRDTEGETQEFDINLDEFADEIEGWVIEEFKRIGCDTARSVLDLTADELERRTDLERVTIDEVRKVLKEEFEQG